MTKKAASKKNQTVTTWRPKEQVETVYVDNPYYSRDHEKSGSNPPKIKAQVNVRESAIATLAARKHIDEAQLAAATKFRALWEAIGGAGAGSIDYSREPVDGGGMQEALTERQIRAALELKRAKAVLGNRAYDIMTKVAGQGFAVQELAKTHRERTTLTDYLKDGLDELASTWGYSTRRNKRKAA